MYEKNITLVRLVMFSGKRSLLTTYQFGFHKTGFTELALLEQKQFIFENLYNKKLVQTIFMKFAPHFSKLSSVNFVFSLN